ncbi:MAG: hypothetical protein PHS57_03725 [Alphaproteobacteria bacterium]|nr:hypothetical protein [Alphaproteobacteria bacterium]
MPEYFIFEIAKWEPYYFLSIDTGKYREGPYSENVGFEIEATCVFPEKVKGRTAAFDIAGRRNCLMPPIAQDDPDWTPRCVGELELSPTYGRFYSSIPHESVQIVLSALAHGLFRFILVYGPPLKRSKSPCSFMQFKRTVDLDEY